MVGMWDRESIMFENTSFKCVYTSLKKKFMQHNFTLCLIFKYFKRFLLIIFFWVNLVKVSIERMGERI